MGRVNPDGTGQRSRPGESTDEAVGTLLEVRGENALPEMPRGGFARAAGSGGPAAANIQIETPGPYPNLMGTSFIGPIHSSSRSMSLCSRYGFFTSAILAPWTSILAMSQLPRPIWPQ